MKRISLRITGKVQGVFFRATTKDRADQLGLAGFVRNEPDGSVFAEAEGEADSLERFAAWCRQGPPRSRVLTLVMEELEPKGYVGFKIDHG
jgi:acylphosphatase